MKTVAGLTGVVSLLIPMSFGKDFRTVDFCAVPFSKDRNYLCADDPLSISFPAYGVTTGDALEPRMWTAGLYNCTAVLWYDRAQRKAVLAHFTRMPQPLEDVSERYAYSREEYIRFFRREYFSSSAGSDISVLIILGKATPRSDHLATKDAVIRYFPQARLLVDDESDPCARRDIYFDTRTGEARILERYTNDWGSACEAIIVRDVLQNMERYDAEERERRLPEVVGTLIKKYSHLVMRTKTWEL